MSKLVIAVFIGVVLGFTGMWVVRTSPAHDWPAPTASTSTDVKPRAHALQLPPAKRAALGIELARPTSVTVSPTNAAFGYVLDPAPYLTLLTELATAQLSAQASEKETARARELFAADTNVSAQSLAAAAAIAARDAVAVAATRARLVTGWGQKLSSVDPEAMIAAFTGGCSLAQLNVLPGGEADSAYSHVTVSLPDGKRHDAEIMGPAAVTDAQIQGAGYLLLIRNSALPIGARVYAELSVAGDAVQLLAVPRSAVVYHQGSAWVYVLGEDDTFERRLILTGRAVEEGGLIASGIEAEQQVVISGAQQLLSSELQSGEVEEED